jgi:methylase of polypeptide subunit release factors
MTQALEAAIAAPAKLPPDEQDALSALLVAEMHSEQRWSDLFSQSQGLLAELAQQALLDHAAGKTQSLLE